MSEEVETATAEEAPKEKTLKAKKTSLLGQIFAAVWLAGWCAYKFIKGGVLNISIEDVILSAIGIIACFSPVYFSIMLDKIKAIRFGD